MPKAKSARRSPSKSRPDLKRSRGKYRPTKTEQGLFTVRQVGESPTTLTPEQEALAKRYARLWVTNEARVWGIQKRNLARNETLGIARAK